MSITPVTPDYTSDSGTTYPLNIDQGLASAQIVANQFQPHEAATPNMTVIIDPGSLMIGITHTVKAQQTTSTITAPVTNPRIDRIAIDITTGLYVIIAGTEAASPVAPSYSVNHYPVCQIALATSTTQITNSLITDERASTSRSIKSSFSVHRNGTAQSNITGIDKIEWTDKEFDTNSDFDEVTNYRFTPTVAGKYLINATISWTSVTSGDYIAIFLYKNGVSFKKTGDSGAASGDTSQITAVVDMNGSTDYLEIFAENEARNTSDLSGNTDLTYWTGCKVG